MTRLPLGKTPARKGAIKLRLENYVSLKTLSPAPPFFGHDGLIDNWGMLGNDQYGDCVWAGAAHETMLWNAEASRAVEFIDEGVLNDYSAVTGFDPNNPNTDNGTDMQKAAAYRQHVGILDATGARHTVDAYVNVKRRSYDWVTKAAYTFGAVGVGLRFPRSAMDQFNAGKTWSYVPFSPIEGGHYVPVIGRHPNGNLICVTWGQVHEMTPAFFWKYNDENIAYLSLEALTNRVSLEGFDLAQLRADLTAVRAQRV